MPQDMEERVFDLVLIGAGINGAGVDRDAAVRGLRVLLDGDDFSGDAVGVDPALHTRALARTGAGLERGRRETVVFDLDGTLLETERGLLDGRRSARMGGSREWARPPGPVALVRA